jgi:hypothetical protein
VWEHARKLVDAKKAAYLKAAGALRYEACGFEFGLAYGERRRASTKCITPSRFIKLPTQRLGIDGRN